MSLSVEELVRPAAFAEAESDLIGIARIANAIQREAWGHDDYSTTPTALWQFWSPDGLYQTRRWVIRDGDEIIASALLALPLVDNRHLAYVGVNVDAGHRRRGLGERLADVVESEARREGRTTALSTTWHGAAALSATDSTDRLIASDDIGWVPSAGAAVAFARGRGYGLDLVNRASVCEPEVGELARLRDGTREATAAYRFVEFSGRVPDEWVDQLAALYGQMADAPMGGLDMQEEVWSAERIRTMEAHDDANGRTAHITAALTAEGEMVAFTLLYTDAERPEKGDQEETLVTAAHRGHRLGLAVKTRSMIRVAGDHPQLRRIYTWNAAQNEHMLAINTTVGFRPAGASGNWQLSL